MKQFIEKLPTESDCFMNLIWAFPGVSIEKKNQGWSV